jgi:hypothetical protein
LRKQQVSLEHTSTFLSEWSRCALEVNLWRYKKCTFSSQSLYIFDLTIFIAEYKQIEGAKHKQKAADKEASA